jgi:hypothetical protein
MVQPAHRVFLLLLCMAALCGSVYAQTEKTVTIRMLDSKTGLLIATSDFQVRVNHEATVHGDWVKLNEEGTGKLTLPNDADVVSIHATYDGAMYIYTNCDAVKDRGSSQRVASPDRWYSVSAILKSGVLAPNDCVGNKVPDRLQVVAKPGEFVFFVRKLTALEQSRE